MELLPYSITSTTSIQSDSTMILLQPTCPARINLFRRACASAVVAWSTNWNVRVSRCQKETMVIPYNRVRPLWTAILMKTTLVNLSLAPPLPLLVRWSMHLFVLPSLKVIGKRISPQALKLGRAWLLVAVLNVELIQSIQLPKYILLLYKFLFISLI